MISYYELLRMIKEGNIPEKVKVHLYAESQIYIKYETYGEFEYYGLENENAADDNFRYYLNECFLDSGMFNKCIEIIDNNKIKKIELDDDCIVDYDDADRHYLNTNRKDRNIYIKKINEIIDKLNKLTDLQDK